MAERVRVSPDERFFSANDFLPPKSLYGIAMFYYRTLLMLLGKHLLAGEAGRVGCGLPVSRLLKEQSLCDLYNYIMRGGRLDNDLAQVLKIIYGEEREGGLRKLSRRLEELFEKNGGEKCAELGGTLRCIIEWYPELLIPERARNIHGDYDYVRECIILLQKYLEMLLNNREMTSELLEFSMIHKVPLRIKPTNYYALLYVDMDTATPFFQGITRGEVLALAVSGYLVSEVFERNIYGRVLASGMPGFIGGDDAVFFLPPEDAFKLLADYTALQEEVGMKASAAVIFAHSRIPLRIAMKGLFRAMFLAKNSRLGSYRPKNSVAVARITGSGKMSTYVLPVVAVGGYSALRKYVEIGAFYAFQRHVTPSFNLRVKALQRALSGDEPSSVALAISKLEEVLEGEHAGKELLGILYALAGSPDKRPVFEAFTGLLSIVSSNDILGSSIFPQYRMWGGIGEP